MKNDQSFTLIKDDITLYEKVVVIGANNVGKSKLILNLFQINEIKNYENDSKEETIFNENKAIFSHGKTLAKKLYIIESSYIKLDYIRALCYLCNYIIIVFDITNNYSFEIASQILNMIRFEINLISINIFLVSTKHDIEETDCFVDENEINDLLNKNQRSKSSASQLTSYVNENIKINYIKISNTIGTGISTLKDLLAEVFNDDILLDNNLNINKNQKELIYEKGISPKSFIKTVEKNEKYEYLYKIILLGDSTVGKTAFYNRLYKNQFNTNFISTIGINVDSKFITIQDQFCKIQIWDTAGQEKFLAVPKQYYEKVDGIILIYDVTNEDTFLDIKKWIKDINDCSNTNLIIYLIGNKIDLISERVINYEDAIKQLKEYKDINIKYNEISCKWNLNVNEVFYNLIMDIHIFNFDHFNNKENIKLNNKEHKNSCC